MIKSFNLKLFNKPCELSTINSVFIEHGEGTPLCRDRHRVNQMGIDIAILMYTIK